MNDHYKTGLYAPWRVIREWGCNFFIGNAIKYLARYLLKHPDPKDDLLKAVDYIFYEVQSHGTLSKKQVVFLVDIVKRLLHDEDQLKEYDEETLKSIYSITYYLKGKFEYFPE